MDPNANNYNPASEIDDGSCTYDRYTITVSSQDNGSATGGGTYNNGASVQLVATPNEGYEFEKWEDPDDVMESTGGIVGIILVVSKSATVTAKFQEIWYP